MKTARLFILFGGILLLASAGLHTLGYFLHGREILGKASVDAGLAALLRTFWLSGSVQFAVLGLVVLIARGISRGYRLVLLCAAACVVNLVLLIVFIGFAPPFYLFLVTAVLLFIGGWLQGKSTQLPSS